MGRERSKHLDLPPRLICRPKTNGNFYYYSTKGPPRKEIALGNDKEHALAEYLRITAAEKFSRVPIPKGFPALLFTRVKKNAAARNIAVEIQIEHINVMFERAAGKCELTGLPFDFTVTKGQRIRPWVPSVDRISAAEIYTPGNCRLVCAAVNLALNQFGEDLLIAIATGLLKTQTGRRTLAFADQATPRGPEFFLKKAEDPHE